MRPVRPVEPFYREMGRELRKIRLMRGLSMYKVEKDAGLSTSMVTYYENGARRISMLTFVRVCGVLGVEPSDVLMLVLAKLGTSEKEEET